MPKGLKGFQPGNRVGKGKQKKTIDKEIALEELRQTVLKEIKPMLRSAVSNATGLTVMFQKKKVKNKKTNKFERTGDLIRVTDADRVEELLKGNCLGDDWYYITTKDPNIQALNTLLDRTFGKAKESLELSGTNGGPVELEVSLQEKINKAYGN